VHFPQEHLLDWNQPEKEMPSWIAKKNAKVPFKEDRERSPDDEDEIY